jgi:ABC-type branched-subunit amino acid transport system substrate-binding protein
MDNSRSAEKTMNWRLCLYCLSFLILLGVGRNARGEDTGGIGVLIPLSGPYTVLGEDCKDGISLALSTAHLPDIRITYGDSVGEAKAGVSEFKKLTEENGVIAVLLIRTPTAMAVNPLSLRMKVPIVGVAGHHLFAKQNEYAFQFWPPGTVEGGRLAHFAKEKRFAIVTTEDEWMISVSDGFRETFLADGGSVVLDETTPGEEQNLSSLALRVRSSGAEALFANLAIGQIGPFVRRLRELGVSFPIYSNYFTSKQDVIASGGLANVEGVAFVETSLAKPRFREGLIGLGRTREPSSMTYDCYAGATFLFQSLKDLKESLSRASLYQSLLRTNRVRLADEELKLTNRVAQLTLSLKHIRNGMVTEAIEH